MVRVTETHLLVGRQLRIPIDEIELRTSRSSGPGGQHVNKTESKVDARLDVLSAATLSDQQRTRLLDRVGPVVQATAQDSRSQSRNRELALIRLGEKIEQALKVKRLRVATKPTKSARESRLKSKRITGAKKAARRSPSDDLD